MLHRVLLGLVAVCLGIARSSEVVSLLEHDFNLETSMNSPKANLKLFEDIDIDKIQAFFSTFNQDLSPQEAKKLYKNLASLSVDTKKYVHSSEITSRMEINKFIDAGLILLHKQFKFSADLDEFFKKHNGKEEFELLNNVVDDEMFKSKDWQSKRFDV